MSTDHEHQWGLLERSHFAGTVHRKCIVGDCGFVNAYDDEADDEGNMPEEYAANHAYKAGRDDAENGTPLARDWSRGHYDTTDQRFLRKTQEAYEQGWKGER